VPYEERFTEMGFEGGNVPRDCTVGDVQLGGRAGEAPVANRGIECAQRR
jgi:hypothetical protein